MSHYCPNDNRAGYIERCKSGSRRGWCKPTIAIWQGGASLLHNTYGQSRGRNGNYSTNWQLSGRELLDASEVRMLDNRYALLFIRGERPVQDFKYDILKHPNIKLTADGGAEPYRHGEDTRSIASIVIDPALLEQLGSPQSHVTLWGEEQPRSGELSTSAAEAMSAVRCDEELNAGNHDFVLLTEEELEELFKKSEVTRK